jgi:hypothetical protein
MIKTLEFVAKLNHIIVSICSARERLILKSLNFLAINFNSFIRQNTEQQEQKPLEFRITDESPKNNVRAAHYVFFSLF